MHTPCCYDLMSYLRAQRSDTRSFWHRDRIPKLLKSDLSGKYLLTTLLSGSKQNRPIVAGRKEMNGTATAADVDQRDDVSRYYGQVLTSTKVI